MSYRFDNPEDFRSTRQDSPAIGHGENLFREAQHEQGLRPFNGRTDDEAQSSEQGYLNMPPMDYRADSGSGAGESPTAGHHSKHGTSCEHEGSLDSDRHAGRYKEKEFAESGEGREPARNSQPVTAGPKLRT